MNAGSNGKVRSEFPGGISALVCRPCRKVVDDPIKAEYPLLGCPTCGNILVETTIFNNHRPPIRQQRLA